MTIVSCIGSPRKNGNTARAAALLVEELRSAARTRDVDLTVDTVFLSDLRIELCRGCRACFDRGEDHCPHHDDLPTLRDKLLHADGVILSSPVYVNDVSGTMKNVIDRLAFTCHRPTFQKVTACFLATTGSSPMRHTLRTLQGAWLSMGGPGRNTVGLKTGALSTQNEIKRIHARRINRLAQHFFIAIEEKAYEKAGFASLLIFCIQQKSWYRISKKKGETLDSMYWLSQGWFDRRCTFFVPHRASPLKVVAARALGTFLSFVFSR